jgi:Lar family restriction alleviation protein
MQKGETMKLCKDCASYKPDGYCKSKKRINPVTGEKIFPDSVAASMRCAELHCGKEARWFGEKEPEIKPCPFCGETDIHLHGTDYDATIECSECRIGITLPTSEECLERWNRRDG